MAAKIIYNIAIFAACAIAMIRSQSSPLKIVKTLAFAILQSKTIKIEKDEKEFIGLSQLEEAHSEKDAKIDELVKTNHQLKKELSNLRQKLEEKEKELIIIKSEKNHLLKEEVNFLEKIEQKLIPFSVLEKNITPKKESSQNITAPKSESSSPNVTPPKIELSSPIAPLKNESSSPKITSPKKELNPNITPKNKINFNIIPKKKSKKESSKKKSKAKTAIRPLWRSK